MRFVPIGGKKQSEDFAEPKFSFYLSNATNQLILQHRLLQHPRKHIRFLEQIAVFNWSWSGQARTVRVFGKSNRKHKPQLNPTFRVFRVNHKWFSAARTNPVKSALLLLSTILVSKEGLSD